MKKWGKTVLTILTVVSAVVLALSLTTCNDDGSKPADTTPSDTSDGAANVNEDEKSDMLDYDNNDIDKDDSGSDLPYWNGLNFGPNLTYAEEYESKGVSGEYIKAAEAAKLTFDDVKSSGYITDYSDSVEYTMALVDITDIDDKECYVYRCDWGVFEKSRTKQCVDL